MSKQHLIRILDTFGYILLLSAVVLVPLLLDRSLVNFYVLPKQYALAGLVLLNLLSWAVRIVLSRQINYRRSFLDFSIVGLLLVTLASVLLSVQRGDSFFGRNEYFVANFSILFFSALYYLLSINQLSSVRRWRGLLDVLLLVGGVSAALFLSKIVFHLDLLAYWYGAVSNTVDGLNSGFGLWLILIFVLSAGQLIKRDLPVGRSLFCFLVAILSLISVLLIGFKILLWLLLVGLVLLLLLGISFIREARLWWLSALFAIIIVSAVMVIFGSPKALQSFAPTEVVLGAKASWNIAYQTVLSGAKNFLLGSGPGSFVVSFSQFRSVAFNSDSLAWSLRFNQPFSSILALLSEGGVLSFLLLILISLFVLGHVFQGWLKIHSLGHESYGYQANDVGGLRLEVLLVTAGWLLLSLGAAVIYLGPAVWWLWWFLLGLIVSGLGLLKARVFFDKQWTLADTPQYNLSFSFVIIVFMAAAVLVGVWGARMYLAESAYAIALRAGNDLTAERQLLRAIERRPDVDVYHSALAQTYLSEAVALSKEEKPDVTTISQLMAKAVNEARLATDISPRSVAIWENLATMYENAVVLVPEAREWAIKSLQQAKDLEPTNPVLWWRLGNNYAGANQKDDALKSYQRAIELKPDYLVAYISLASLQEQDKQTDLAVETYQKAMSVAGAGSPELLFNYGRLLYNRNQRNDRADTETLWLKAVELQPNYSNALYSLGLLYEARGDKMSALKYFYKVRDLNPNNKDVLYKIQTLVVEKAN